MPRFSISEAFSYSFLSYRRHFFSVMFVAACMALGMWLCTAVPEVVSNKITLPDMAKVAEIGRQQEQLGAQKAHEMLRALFDKVSFTQFLLMIVVYLLSFFLYVFLCLGFTRAILGLKDHHKLEPAQAFHISLRQVLRFFGAVILIFCRIIGWILVGVLGVAAIAFVANKVMLGQQMIGLLVMGTIFAMGCFVSYWYAPYVFLSFVIVDKTSLGVRAALKECKFLVRAKQGRLLLALGAISLILIPIVLILVVPTMILALRSGIGTVAGQALGQALCVILMYPPFFLFISFLYRALSHSKEHASE